MNPTPPSIPRRHWTAPPTKLLPALLAAVLCLATSVFAGVPTVTTGAASNIGARGATLNAVVNPNGVATGVRFQFGTTLDYGSSTPLQAAGDGALNVEVHAPIGNLTPGATYHYRAVAITRSPTTGAESATPGADQTFTTTAISTNPPSATTGAAAELQPTGAVATGSVTPNGAPTAVRFDFGLDANYGRSTPMQNVGDGNNPVAVRAPMTNLQPSTTYHFRLVAVNGNGTVNGGDQTFTTPDGAPTNPPTITTGEATNVGASGAVLNATCNPNGQPSGVRFEFGPTTSYGQTTQGQLVGDGTAQVAVHIPVGNLQPATTYHYRGVLITHTATGAEVRINGEDRVFTTANAPTATAPAATTGAAAEVQAGGAVLTASVNPNGGATAVKFEFGADASYGRFSPALNIGGGASAVPVRIPVGGLTPNTTYHFRVVATNAAGTSTGGDQSFTTLPGAAPGIYTAPASAVTATSAQLNGRLITNGKTLTVSFDYGTTTAYGASTEGKQVTGGSIGVEVHAPVMGLSAHTVYHYRIAASDGAQAVTGADQTFRTPNTPPTVESDLLILADGAASGTIAVLNNDKDADGDTLTIAKVSQGEAGAVTLNVDGTITYTPGAGFRGRDRFSYVVQDGFGGVATGAVLVQSPIVASSGVYNSLVVSDPAAHETSGFIRLTTNAAGSFSGALKFAGVEYPIKGRFDNAGNYAVTLNVRNSDVDLALALQFDTASQRITGTVTAGASVSILSADRIPFTAAHPATQAGRYTALLPLDGSADSAAPQGTGFGALTVTPLGQATLTCRLGDGTPVTIGALLNGNGTLPLYASLYRAKGSAFGTVTFRDTPHISDCDGSVRWFKPAAPVAANATPAAGLAATVNFVGSAYTAPEKGARVLDLADGAGNATLAFTPANASSSTTKAVTITVGNRVLPPDGDRTVAMSIAPATGLFSGNVVLPGATAGTTARGAFSGVVLQKQNLGGGLLITGEQTGSVSLTATAPPPSTQ